jgi:calcium/calmodulin-dependent protein kinase I
MLGEGGFATVYQAKHKSSGKVFAVKKIRRKGLTIEQQVHVKQEADILRLLAHPNIVKLYSLYEEDTQFDMVMELVTGGELFDRIVAKASYNESEARDLVSAITQNTQNDMNMHHMLLAFVILSSSLDVHAIVHATDKDTAGNSQIHAL